MLNSIRYIPERTKPCLAVSPLDRVSSAPHSALPAMVVGAGGASQDARSGGPPHGGYRAILTWTRQSISWSSTLGVSAWISMRVVLGL